jgi:aspartate-semialdehyde dehydrogenase
MIKTEKKRVAIIGATGMVGRAIVDVLASRGFPVGELVPGATGSSGGRTVDGFGKSWPVKKAEEIDYSGVEYGFFTAGAEVSQSLVPRAVECGCRVIDNTTAFRMHDDVPLVVPEINGMLVSPETRLAACPNCTTIILVMTLAPLLRSAVIERVVVTSFQSVSGAGRDAVDELNAQIKSDLSERSPTVRAFPKQIAFNCLPQVGDVRESGYCKEEEKIIEETRKILSRPELHIVPTTVRVPVRVGHAISVNVEFADELSPDDARNLWQQSAGVVIDGDPPTPLDAAGSDQILIGRVRKDASRPHAVSYWAVGDNLRKGAATNSVQIAELMTLEFG